jgi:hypothetical protein
VVFGLKPAKELLKKEKLLSIVRAHQVKPNGYEFHNWEGNFPTVITIFSAPNYEQLENNGAVLISTAAGGFDVRTFQENDEQQSIYEDNQDMLSLMQPRMNALVFQMITNMLEYGSSKFTPGIAKSLSNDKNLDKAYLQKVIEGCKGETKKEPAKMGLKINIAKKKEPKKPVEKTVAKPKDQVSNDLEKLNIDIEDSSDEDALEADLLAQKQMDEKVEFYRKQSSQMMEVANKIERGFSLNKAVTEQKIPELLKRKTSLQQSLQVDVGSALKIKTMKDAEWDRPHDKKSGKTEEGEEFEISTPLEPVDE